MNSHATHPGPSGKGRSALLLGRPDDLVDSRVTRLGDHVEDGPGYVVGLHLLDPGKPLLDRLSDLGPVVAGQLGGHRSRLDEPDPDVATGDLLAQALTEGVDAPLGGVVDGASGAGDPARPRRRG